MKDILQPQLKDGAAVSEAGVEEEEGQELSTELGVSVDSAQTRRIPPEDTREPQSPGP